jgi:septum formation topological specificity factor MinE
MGDNEKPPYNGRDDWVIANNIFHELCELDANDRQADNNSSWLDLRVLVKKRSEAYHIKEDLPHLAEDILEHERKFIERDPHTLNVKLTGLGRTNCGRQIDGRIAEEP